MRLDDPVEVLLGRGLAAGGRGGACSERGRARPLHAGVAVRLVVVADVEEIGAPLKSAGERLNPDIDRPAVTCVDDDVGLFPERAKSVAQAGSAGGGCGKRYIIDRHVHRRVGVDPLDDAGAAGGHDQNGIGAGRFEHVAQTQGRAAPRTGGRALIQILLLRNRGQIVYTPLIYICHQL